MSRYEKKRMRTPFIKPHVSIGVRDLKAPLLGRSRSVLYHVTLRQCFSDNWIALTFLGEGTLPVIRMGTKLRSTTLLFYLASVL